MNTPETNVTGIKPFTCECENGHTKITWESYWDSNCPLCESMAESIELNERMKSAIGELREAQRNIEKVKKLTKELQEQIG